jgi:hypothetical protein
MNLKLAENDVRKNFNFAKTLLLNAMKKLILLSGLLALSMNMMGQEPDENMPVHDMPGMARPFEQPDSMPMRPRERKTVYEQVDELRNKFGLNSKQFDKTYSAYDKFHKAIFGDDSSTMVMGGGMPGGGGMGGPGGGGMGGPGGGGMGGPGGGGMGGPGGGGMGGPGGGGMGGPGGMGGRPNFSATSPRNKMQEPMTEKDMQKLQKKIAKQEEKLEKSMRKVLTDDDQYNEWLAMRQEELRHPLF